MTSVPKKKRGSLRVDIILFSNRLERVNTTGSREIRIAAKMHEMSRGFGAWCPKTD